MEKTWVSVLAVAAARPLTLFMELLLLWNVNNNSPSGMIEWMLECREVIGVSESSGTETGEERGRKRAISRSMPSIVFLATRGVYFALASSGWMAAQSRWPS